MKNILVVEDDLALARAIVRKLKLEGFGVDQVDNVPDALNIISKNKIDAIWLDHYLLEKETGLDFLEKIKKHKEWSNIPVFVVTNSVGDDKVRKYTILGIEKYYIKAESSLANIIKDIDNFFLEEKGKDA